MKAHAAACISKWSSASERQNSDVPEFFNGVIKSYVYNEKAGKDKFVIAFTDGTQYDLGKSLGSVIGTYNGVSSEGVFECSSANS